MHSKIAVSLLVLSLLAVSGCTPPNIQTIKLPANDNPATITVFRPDVKFNMLNEMIVAVNNIDIATLLNNQYTSVHVDPGEHTIAVRGSAGSTSSLKVNIKPSETLYFEAAGSSNNAINFIPGTYLLKSNFYIEKADTFDIEKYTEKKVIYK